MGRAVAILQLGELGAGLASAYAAMITERPSVVWRRSGMVQVWCRRPAKVKAGGAVTLPLTSSYRCSAPIGRLQTMQRQGIALRLRAGMVARLGWSEGTGKAAIGA